MAIIYYIAKLSVGNPHYDGSCLIRNGGNKELLWGTTNPQAHAHRFSSEEDALGALKQFFECSDRSIYRIWVSGQVCRVTEEAVGPVIAPERIESRQGVTEDPEDVLEDLGNPEAREHALKLDLEEGEALTTALKELPDDAHPSYIQDQRHIAAEWFLDHAAEIFDALRERERLVRRSAKYFKDVQDLDDQARNHLKNLRKETSEILALLDSRPVFKNSL